MLVLMEAGLLLRKQAYEMKVGTWLYGSRHVCYGNRIVNVEAGTPYEIHRLGVSP